MVRFDSVVSFLLISHLGERKAGEPCGKPPTLEDDILFAWSSLSMEEPHGDPGTHIHAKITKSKEKQKQNAIERSQ